jgi:branched-chain amino acid transport system permease protein
MRTIGYRVEAHRFSAFCLGGLVASIGGTLGVWYNSAISPGTIDLSRTINLLVIAVVVGLAYVKRAFVGAVTFATNDARSFTTVSTQQSA